MSDRTVHARKRESELVRYERAGKWYYEGPEGRRNIGVREAAMIARQWRDEGGVVYLTRPGGRLFDQIMGES